MYYLFAMAAALSALLTGPLLFVLRRINAGQIIREEGPPEHKKKSGTPTMGGLGFLAIIFSLALLFVDFKYLPILLITSGYALLGFVDDILKLINHRNLGLTFWQKIIVQTLLAAILSLYLLCGGMGLDLPAGRQVMTFGFWIFLIVGSANATNLTDGLDGLLSGTMILALLGFAGVYFKNAQMGAMALCFISAGAVFGFLLFNFPKARLFMGDVGSLSLGALLAGMAIITRHEWFLAVIGGVFLLEALSVIIQVFSFKFFGKRVFKMAPLHHHFELLGLSETVVVLIFWLAQLILSIIGVWIA
ncbi:phospho-N-acetylmuramoyl-pentapeptide-transferase [Candidatus Saganbacteria bacterium]|nr:phospho-N-acetylmuramoyl-pentapeptide-transferase [Candidatus Saganbacteria bacterium]